MWCTRWYLPLVLLPLPTASPYFLVLFLFSTTLHAKPCFYCIVLMTAMFLSSCYWPPAPLDTALSTPWSENITTFSDALRYMMPTISDSAVPSDIPIVDHCWCDLTSGQFFEPFNMTQWEVDSVKSLKKKLEKKLEVSGDGSGSPPSSTTRYPEQKPSSSWSTMWESVWPFSKLTSDAHPSSTGTAPSKDNSLDSTAKSTRWLRPEYDLGWTGFDVIIDFGWSKT